jgi:hypothetical protein
VPRNTAPELERLLREFVELATGLG